MLLKSKNRKYVLLPARRLSLYGVSLCCAYPCIFIDYNYHLLTAAVGIVGSPAVASITFVADIKPIYARASTATRQ